MDEKQKEIVKDSTVQKESRRKTALARGLFKRKSKKKEEETETKPTRWVQIRLFPIWLRILLVLLLLIGVALLGAYIGYSVLGDESPSDIFQKETWMHITNIIQGVE